MLQFLLPYPMPVKFASRTSCTAFRCLTFHSAGLSIPAHHPAVVADTIATLARTLEVGSRYLGPLTPRVAQDDLIPHRPAIGGRVHRHTEEGRVGRDLDGCPLTSSVVEDDSR